MSNRFATTKAGWYAATDRPNEQRYWDGIAWTESYQPVPNVRPRKPPHSAGYWILQIIGVIILLPIFAVVMFMVIGSFHASP